MRLSLASLFYISPTLLRGILSLVVLRLSTQILGPSDYGLYGVFTLFVQICVSTAMSGVEYLLYGSFKKSHPDQKASLLSTTFWISIGVASILSGAISLCVGIFGRGFVDPSLPPIWVIQWMIPFLIVGAIPWSFGVLITIAYSRATTYAVCSMLEFVISNIVFLTALFLFHLKSLSLFLGALAGTVVTAIYGIVLISPYLRFRVNYEWVVELFRVAPAAALNNSVDRGYSFLEKTVLAATAGLSQVGLYTHSQNYKNLFAMAVKSVALTIWPVSMREAQADPPSFEQTQRIWGIVFLLVGCSGIAFAFVAEPVISFLTNDKFTSAYPLAVLWLVVLLFQNTGKTAVATIYANGSMGQAYSNIGTVSSLIAILVALSLIPFIGIYGAAIATFVQVLIFRFSVIRLASRVSDRLPSQDALAFQGSAFVLLALGVKHLFRMSSLMEILVALSLEICYVWLARKNLRDLTLILLAMINGITSQLSTNNKNAQ